MTTDRPPLHTDSRRLFGPSLWLDAPGAALEVPLPHGHVDALARGWAARALWMTAALGWRDVALSERRHRAGMTLALSAPRDALMSATALSEWALQATADELALPYDAAALDDDALPVDQAEALEALRGRVEAESGAAAAARADGNSDALHDRDIPIAVVTGSNGKTTTTRLLAAMLRAQGHVVGLTSTEGVVIGDERVVEGDWSGPEGARRVLRDARVTAAVLETARGGMLRRGIVVPRADVAIVTNVAEDHFGEYGVDDLATLAQVKTSVAHALGARGTLVLNGDDPLLDPSRATARLAGVARALPRERIATFSLEAPWPTWLPDPAEIPIALGGAARFNLANVLAAATAARLLGVPDASIASAVRAFGSDPRDNAGRLMRLDVGGVTVLVDYAHNPHGLAALLVAARALNPQRLLLALGQAGDRDDDAIRALARTAWDAQPTHIALQDLEGYLRGRAAGAVPAILADALTTLGARPDQLSIGLDEADAARTLLALAQPGDVVLLPVHALAARERLLQWLEGLRAAAWNAGRALPDDA